jgi:hypothetical protein
MKVEKRADSVFIAHGGVAIFADRVKNEAYHVRVNRRVHDIDGKETWVTVGEMDVPRVDFQKWAELLGALAQ